MTEYKHIELDDATDPGASVLKEFIDKLELFQQKYITSIKKNGERLEISWNTWMPRGFSEKKFIEKICSLTGAAKVDLTVIPKFGLSPSLVNALSEILKSEAEERACKATIEELERLESWRLVDAEFEYDYLGQDIITANGTLYFRKTLIKASITAKGKKYLEQGYLDSIKD